MKICAVIAEYNPFHLGHLKQIDYIKEKLKADKIIIVMSGDFTQRGEGAVLNKFTRARHAVIAGADAVIELPVVFSTANAETFAKGAISIINSLNCVDSICFGVESGSSTDYTSLARVLVDESKEYKKQLKLELDKGVSLAKAKLDALKTTYGDKIDVSLMSSPNNVLGLEYVKALLSLNSKIEICPLVRENDHNDKTLKKGITSASSIRETIKKGKIKRVKKSLPPFTYKDLKEIPDFDKVIMSSVLLTNTNELSEVPDCTEGLENRIKALSKDNQTVEKLINKTTTKRYTSSRIRRILMQNLLKITKDFTKDCLGSPLYAKVLAVNKDSLDIVSIMQQNSTIPILTRKSDQAKLKKTALACFEKDILASDLYSLIAEENINENITLFI